MNNLYALIVGIEKYDLLPNANRSGPAAGAIAMANWCHQIGMPFGNIRMFLSLDEDAESTQVQRDALESLTESGAKVVEDTNLDAVDTFWRHELPNLPNGESKLLVYWCGHGVTLSNRDRIILHSDYNTNNLKGRVTSLNDFRATLATQLYERFREQLIVADVCGDFRGQVSPNPQLPAKPVNSIVQHCYFASLDGVSTAIQNGIGEFTESTLGILRQYQQWPDLDRLEEAMRNGNLKSYKLSIRAPRNDRDDGDRKSDSAIESNSQPPLPAASNLPIQIADGSKKMNGDTHQVSPIRLVPIFRGGYASANRSLTPLFKRVLDCSLDENRAHFVLKKPLGDRTFIIGCIADSANLTQANPTEEITSYGFAFMCLFDMEEASFGRRPDPKNRRRTISVKIILPTDKLGWEGCHVNHKIHKFKYRDPAIFCKKIVVVAKEQDLAEVICTAKSDSKSFYVTVNP